MASITEILKTLTKLEKSSYRDVIDVSLTQFNSKTVEMEILQRFYTGRYNREKALYDAIESKSKSSSITSSYSVFRTILAFVTGKNTELDDMNGVLNQNIYSSAGNQRERRRVIAELGKRGSALSLNIINKFSTYKTKLTDLKNQLT